MKYTSINGLKISKLSLGTAQLGFDYGIANVSGKPNLDKSFEILKTAFNAGINCFDTAPSYGDSEEIIGSFVGDISDEESPIICTKLKIEFDDGTNSVEIYQQVKQNVEGSMRRLQMKKIPILLLHSASNMTDNGGLILQSLIRLKNEGMVDKIGVSVYSPKEVIKAIDLGVFDAIQIPINIFDHRLIDSGILNSLKQHNFIVFARSIFLQGLFFLDPEALPENLKLAREPLITLRKLAQKYEIDIAEMAVSFVRDLPERSSMVIGAETSAQVLNNCDLIECPKLSDELKDEILNVFNDLPEKIINPSLWN
ncbi:MAG: aldo/keto reductase [Candidatus Eremiobacteraeota bacterium]|nr:aldo/keto reductase [Candidatus Eremiobacteraeota bacterium]